jgi:hypothetical protein
MDLTLDPAIRDWCLLPMMGMVVMVALLRQHITALLKSDKPAEKEELKNKGLIKRAQRLRTSGKFICSSAFSSRRAYLTAKEHGVLRSEDVPGPENPMSDPSKMMEPMKNQMGFLVTNAVMMGFSGYFFGGFVLVRVPFPLTNRFKVMLQRGVELTTLDPSYVSSISWYFLVMFGMRSIINLFLGEQASLDEEKAMQAQMGGGQQQMGFDAKKAFQLEADSLDLVEHSWALDDVEKRLLGKRYPRTSLLLSAGMPSAMGKKGGDASSVADRQQKKKK